MALETTEKDISIAFKKLAITSNGGNHCKIPTTIFSNFKSKILAAIDKIREKKRRPDIDTIYEYIMKSQASNANKNLIETIIAELTNKSSPSKSNNISNDKLTPQNN